MFTRILLAVDGTETGTVAASFVAGLARQCSATVHVVYVNEYLVGGRGCTRFSEREAQSVVNDTVHLLHLADVAAEGEVCRAYSFDMPTRIVGAALDESADVIVLGARRHRWRGLCVGRGMHQKVADRTMLPTLIAPAPLQAPRRHRLAMPEALWETTHEVPTTLR